MADRATAALRTAILNGDLEPDTLHAVHTVADRLGVSRTPVREAVIRLAADGMVRVHRNRGFIVLGTTAEELRQIFSLRLLLEVPATRAAAVLATDDDIAALEADIERMRQAMDGQDAETFLRADRQFHRTLLTISGNDRLAEFVERTAQHRAQQRGLDRQPERVDRRDPRASRRACSSSCAPTTPPGRRARCTATSSRRDIG
ncbi:GntR family transcriptional regulator [Aeromicrobium sp. UC242_57]|uniref:GntR family transcriptional regulator n=1 Tax=Aeromicrobium sp. UC242_57 TaxID=3374624 RepID=UPI003793E80D